MQTSHQKEIIRALKEGKRGDLPIMRDDGVPVGYLVPITEKLADDDEVIESLARWRQEHMDCFQTQFKARKERTRKWLKEIILKDDSKIMFIITEENRRLNGNYGVCKIESKSAELDNMINGERIGDRNLMHYTELRLMYFIIAQ